MSNRAAVNLAIGRIFLLGSRPEKDGDVAQYLRCRAIILDLVEPGPDTSICFARDYGKGAQGQW